MSPGTIRRVTVSDLIVISFKMIYKFVKQQDSQSQQMIVGDVISTATSVPAVSDIFEFHLMWIKGKHHSNSEPYLCCVTPELIR